MAKRRAKLLPSVDNLRIFDPRLCETHSSVEKVCKESDVVVVSTPTYALHPMTMECIQHGARRILVEKPCGVTSKEIDVMTAVAEKTETIIVPGYTLQHYPGIAAAHERVTSGAYGRPLHMRIVYGHGGRSSGWREDRLTGGGELLDQGSHCISLARAFLGIDLNVAAAALTSASPRVESKYIDHAEDNVFLMLKNDKRVAMIHASWTEWAPTFEMRVVCERGCVTVSGLNKTYGPHLAVFHRERGTDEIREYPDAEEIALRAEWDAFLSATYGQARAKLASAWRTLQLIEEARRCSSS